MLDLKLFFQMQNDLNSKAFEIALLIQKINGLSGRIQLTKENFDCVEFDKTDSTQSKFLVKFYEDIKNLRYHYGISIPLEFLTMNHEVLRKNLSAKKGFGDLENTLTRVEEFKGYF